MYTETRVETCAKYCMFKQATGHLVFLIIEINLAVALIIIIIIIVSIITNKFVAAGAKKRM